MLAWLPTYFSMALGVSETHLSVTAVPYMMMVVCTLCGGMVSDNLLKRGLGLLRVRRTMTVYAPAAHLTHGLHCSECPFTRSCTALRVRVGVSGLVSCRRPGG